MPAYEYKCLSCGLESEKILRIRDYKTEFPCPCGGTTYRSFRTPPAVKGDYEAYDCPISGERIEGKVAHEANLRKHGCRVLEPGETERATRNSAAADARLDVEVEATAEAFVSKLSGDEKAALGQAVESGADVSFTRT